MVVTEFEVMLLDADCSQVLGDCLKSGAKLDTKCQYINSLYPDFFALM
jgi:hypothetical protein